MIAIDDEIASWLETARRYAELKQPEHPQLIEGTLYITPEQYSALVKTAEHRNLSTLSMFTPTPLYDIPVRIIKNGEQITLPSGKVLLYRERLGMFLMSGPVADTMNKMMRDE